jgi:2-dehydro-3-deoxyphosphogluconate aldolase/(4S)-4-hydroxy-2-oxoglutarate aldolase
MSAADSPRRRSRLEAALAGVPVVGILRLTPDASEQATTLVRALAEGGLAVVEIALTTAGALDAVSELVHDRPDGLLVGSGSVRTPDDARAAIAAGADFLVTPTTSEAVITVAREASVPIFAGGLTPTELETAHRAGADFVKLFPASLGGPNYVREVRAPMPDLRIVPTGGVTLEHLGDWLAAGAHAVAVGSALVPVTGAPIDAVFERAERFAAAARAARAADSHA